MARGICGESQCFGCTLLPWEAVCGCDRGLIKSCHGSMSCSVSLQISDSPSLTYLLLSSVMKRKECFSILGTKVGGGGTLDVPVELAKITGCYFCVPDLLSPILLQWLASVSPSFPRSTGVGRGKGREMLVATINFSK